MAVDLYKLKAVSEKAELIEPALDALAATTAAIEAITPDLANLDAVADNLPNIVAVADNEANINAVKLNELNINALALLTTELANLGAITEAISNVDGIKVDVSTVASIDGKIDTIITNLVAIQNADANAQLALTKANEAASSAESTATDKTAVTTMHDTVVAKESALSPHYEAIDAILTNLTAVQNALANATASANSATASANSASEALGYRNEAEGFKNEAQVLAGGEVVSSNVKFSDLTDLETYRTNTDAAINALDLLLQSDNLSLDTLQEIVDFIELNRATLDTLGIANIAGLQAALDAKSADLTAHANNTSNPHAVTKTQVGLSNVDNTSDLLKPISTAQQAALDAKVAITSIVNVLTSTATNVPLSAAQGKVLKDALDGLTSIAITSSNISSQSVSNSTQWNGSTQYTSTSAASGGASGDIWFQYA